MIQDAPVDQVECESRRQLRPRDRHRRDRRLVMQVSSLSSCASRGRCREKVQRRVQGVTINEKKARSRERKRLQQCVTKASALPNLSNRSPGSGRWVENACRETWRSAQRGNGHWLEPARYSPGLGTGGRASEGWMQAPSAVTSVPID